MLSKSQQQVLDNIEAHGYNIMHVAESFSGPDEEPGFSYSIGLYKTYRLPELLIIGLDQELRHALIDNICVDYQEGNALKIGELNSGIVDGYGCLVADVDKDHYPEYLSWARWFYKGDDFPTVQVIYPTLLGYFPWDKEFPKHIIQPILNEKYSQGLK